MAKKSIKAKDINGMSIYQEDKRTIYAPFYTKNAYIITDNNVKEYQNYITGYLISFLVFTISYIISKKIFISICLALLFFIGSFISFYLNFLKKASTIANYKKIKKESFVEKQAHTLDDKRIITIIVCSFLLTFFIYLNAYISNFTGSYMLLTYIIMLIVFLYGILNIYIFIRKHQLTKNKQNNID